MRSFCLIFAAAFGLLSGVAHAVPLNVINASFENDPNTFNEFYFGDPSGWGLIDTGGIIDGGLDVQGTLTATGSAFFNSGVPDGDNVAILFIGTDVGTTEVGLSQILSDTLAADTHYQLSVEVGNIQSGNAQNGSFFNLDGFPGYRIELLAGGFVLASISDGIGAPISEGEFATVTLDFTSGAVPVQLGQALEIRLFNLNITDPNFAGADLEVDFDQVLLDATSIPLPIPLILLGFGMIFFAKRH